MVCEGIVASSHILSDGMTIRCVIVIAVAGMGLAGCSSFSLDAFKSTPPPIQVQLESNPPGADARTSLGPACKTPCSVSIPAPDGNFTVAYSLNKFQPATVQVNVIKNPGDMLSAGTTTIDPNPVVAELQPAGPPPKPMHHSMKPKKPKPPKTAAAPAAPDSAFPDPAAQQGAPSR
jgi:hypothetical protein